MAAMITATPQLIEAAGITVELRRAGRGKPLLVLHGELGVPGWLDSFARLAEHYDVIVPSLPGYGQSTRPEWIMGVHDLAAWVTWFARDLDLPHTSQRNWLFAWRLGRRRDRYCSTAVLEQDGAGGCDGHQARTG